MDAEIIKVRLQRELEGLARTLVPCFPSLCETREKQLQPALARQIFMLQNGNILDKRRAQPHEDEREHGRTLAHAQSNGLRVQSRSKTMMILIH